MAAKKRSDADRRVRQCERLSRLLRLLHLIMGKGRWDADTLAQEMECSRRTIYRMLQTLSLAGVPWYFDESSRAYRVRSGFKFSDLEEKADKPEDGAPLPSAMEPIVDKLIADGEAFAGTLRQFLDELRRSKSAH